MSRTVNLPALLNFPIVKEKIIAAIQQVPRGCVASYGQIAEVAGIVRGARLVARVLRDPGVALPWWRIVRSDGSCAVPGQLARLSAEGLDLQSRKRVDMARYRWQAMDYLLFGGP
jgi:methylated-DNA-protein-cysteine methyltransferase related protein